MQPISSPWLSQLNRKRREYSLTDNAECAVAIVGGGIAGLCTAYFILKNTKQSVILLEAYRVAHGATGHNAGQIASYFEKPFAEIVKEYGKKMASEGQRAVESAWDLLEHIYQDAQLKTPFWSFPGYAGLRDESEVLHHLQDILDLADTGEAAERMLIAESAPFVNTLPAKFKSCYKVVPHHEVLQLLETKNSEFQATLIKRKGCLNSALFTEELAGYLLKTYKQRFVLAEQSPVNTIILRQHSALLTVKQHVIVAKKVILCTNGFEKFTILNTVGTEIDTAFHHMVRGAIGYMAAYLDRAGEPPVAISYLPASGEVDKQAFVTDEYFYLTRRPFEEPGKRGHNLICVGGPELDIEDTTQYVRDEHAFPEHAQKEIDDFLHASFARAPKGKIKYKFRWHGLMGYTPNGLRRIGPEPRNPVLLYNLGCNGVGILPSIYGAARLATLLAGKKVKPTIFDP